MKTLTMLSRRLSVVAIALVALVAAAPAAFADGGGETLEVAVPGTISCTAADGTTLGADPTLHRGDKIVCKLSGFTAGEMIDVTLDPGGTDLGTISANAQGDATYDFTVPADAALGGHTLSFTGETSHGVATFPFSVAEGTPGGGSGGSGPGSGSGGSGPGKLAFTGAFVLGPLLVGAVLVGGGALLTAANRRRRRQG